MGSKCSTIACNGIALPSRKPDPISVTPTSTQKLPKRSSNNKNRRYSRTEEQSTVIENPKSPEHPAGFLIKHNGVQRENTSDDTMKGTNITQITEANVFQYKKGPLIGKGTYGEVFECLRLNTGELLAVKSFKLGGDINKAAGYIEALKKEISLLRGLSHNNIVKYFTVDINEMPSSGSIVDIILEYVSGGSIRLLLDKFSRLEERVVAKYIKQVLDGLVFLHDNEIVHRNIKGSNILIDTTGLIKLTDFGCSGRPDRFSEENPPENIKSPAFYRGYWSAPEVVMKKAQGKPADVWSVGCVVIEMLTGSPPWADHIKTMNDFTRQIEFGTPPPFPKEISENCRDFLYKTLRFKPEDRPSVSALLTHPFVNERNPDSSCESIPELDGQTSPKQVLDLLKLDEQVPEKRQVDYKKNNFVKYTTDELSVTGLNIDAYASFGTNEFNGYALGAGEPLSRFVSSDRFEKDPNFVTLTKKNSNISRLREVPGGPTNGNEDYYSDEVINDMKTGVILKSKSAQQAQPAVKEVEAESKEAIRKRIEEEMKRDLMLISRQLSDAGKDENDSQQNPFMSEEPEEETSLQQKRRAAPIPIQNSYFTNPSKPDVNAIRTQSGNATTQFLKYRNGERKHSHKMGGIAINATDGTARENKTIIEGLVMEKVEEEEDQEAGSPQPLTEAERKLNQERRRKQFEEQMERSLARLNSDNVITVEPEDSMFASSKLSPAGKKPFEEDYSSQIIKISPTKLESMCRNDDKEASENRSSGWKGGWDSHGEDHDASPKGNSFQMMTESEGRSPHEGTNKKRMSEFTKFHLKEVTSASIKNDSFERVEDEDVQEQEYEEIVSGGFPEAETPQNNERKLGIINEAEEGKEHSLYDDELNGKGGLKPKKG